MRLQIRWLRVVVFVTVGLLFGASGASACPGDCNGDGQVAVNELIVGVRIALGEERIGACAAFDQIVVDDRIDISELILCVNAALDGCPRPQISTIVGSGVEGFDGDGNAPTATALGKPQDVTIGPDGTLYVVDWNNHRIRQVRGGIVETVAGSGMLGDAQDGQALYTNFNHPTNVCFDRDGTMLIAAWHNSLVKRLDLETGMTVTVAGTGARAFGGDGGPAREAQLDLPSSCAVDSLGNIIISDQANFRLRVVEPNGTIHTYCGNGTPGFAGDGERCDSPNVQLNAPKGQSAAPASRIAIDGDDNIYIADTENHVVRRIDADTFVIHTIAGTPGQKGYAGDGGPATSALLNTPSDVAVDGNGAVYIADTLNHVVRLVRPDGTIVTLAGTGQRGFAGDGGPADEAKLDRPYGLTVAANGTVYVADTHNQRIRQVTGLSVPPPPTPEPTAPPEIIPCTGEVGSICTYAGNGGSVFTPDGANRLEASFYWPFDIEFTADGRRIFLDWNNHRVREILPDDTIKTLVGTDDVGDGPPDLSDFTAEGADPLTVNLNHPTDIQLLPNGDLMFVAWHNHKIRVIDRETGRVRVLLGAGAAFAGDGGPARDARANQPARAVLDPSGNLFFVDQRNQRIRVLRNFATERENAIVATVAGTGTPGFNGDGPALETQFSFPTGANPEPTGGIARAADGTLYFADTNNHRIRKLTFSGADFTGGTVTTIAGTGAAGFGGDGGPALEAQMDYPQDVEIGPDGNLYFADTNNNRVRMIDLTTGTIATVAGTGEPGYGGDGGPAAAAKLNRPFGLAFDLAGDLYISDTFNGRIRKVER